MMANALAREFTSTSKTMQLRELKPQRRLSGFRYAFRGLATLMETTPNAWIHLAALVAVVLGGFWFDISMGEWAAVAVACVLVFAAETFNTAIEELANFACKNERHPQIARVKDLAAAAVLIAATGAVVVGAVVFGGRIIDLFD